MAKVASSLMSEDTVTNKTVFVGGQLWAGWVRHIGRTLTEHLWKRDLQHRNKYSLSFISMQLFRGSSATILPQSEVCLWLSVWKSRLFGWHGWPLIVLLGVTCSEHHCWHMWASVGCWSLSLWACHYKTLESTDLFTKTSDSSLSKGPCHF